MERRTRARAGRGLSKSGTWSTIFFANARQKRWFAVWVYVSKGAAYRNESWRKVFIGDLGQRSLGQALKLRSSQGLAKSRALVETKHLNNLNYFTSPCISCSCACFPQALRSSAQPCERQWNTSTYPHIEEVMQNHSFNLLIHSKSAGQRMKNNNIFSSINYSRSKKIPSLQALAGKKTQTPLHHLPVLHNQGWTIAAMTQASAAAAAMPLSAAFLAAWAAKI